MSQRLKDQIQHCPISCICFINADLHRGCFLPCLVFKSTNKNHNYFWLSTFRFFLLTFECISEASAGKAYAECFSRALKIAKKITCKKIKGTPPYLSWMNFTKIFHFFYFLSSNLLRWQLLIHGIHRFRRNLFQHSQIFFQMH